MKIGKSTLRISMSSPTDDKKQEAAETRGEANALTKIGAVGAGASGAGWAASELGLVDMYVAWGGFTDPPPSKKAWKTMGIIAGIASVGALIYAGYRHSHADKLEQERRLQSMPDPKSRL